MAWQWAARSKGRRTGKGTTLGADGDGGRGRGQVAGGAGAGLRLSPPVVALTPARWRGWRRRVAPRPTLGPQPTRADPPPGAGPRAESPFLSPSPPTARPVERPGARFAVVV